MEQENKDKWREDAFAKASAEAGLENGVQDKARKVLKSFQKALPAILASIHTTMGGNAALKASGMLIDPVGFDVLVAFFMTGYEQALRDGESVK